MKLLIAIPALNEEDSIVSIIERSLAAKERIVADSPVTEVEITVVSDGSTDRTVERARPYAGRINLIVFEKNRGYGAAIKAAWQGSNAELLGFLDADGTCDPAFFAPLAQTLVHRNADVVLGCRLNPDSKMPLLRRVGNVIFGTILTALSNKRIRDTASGMRVVRRSSLVKLLPLPDGMHFTPAISARALLSEDLSIYEIDMPYREREGQSKLRVIKDGLRFLRVILETSFLYRPSRPLGLMAVVCLVIAIGLMIPPTIYYLNSRSIAEWMIYRFVVSQLLGIISCLLFCTSYLSRRVVFLTLSKAPGAGSLSRSFGTLLKSRFFWLVPIAMYVAGGLLVLPSLRELVTTGATYEHWSRFIVMSGLFAVATILIGARVLDYTLDMVADRLTYLREHDL